ncbi:MAG: tetraacyldisaccharide 4'-kinase [Candidatus Omnitrophica bacterium CG23_combo_of_CG06-09_8_20_14_all_40_11]|nr:MAG: tetraacyldisaccharide 4'-kinase [Candidatus Omnitrophica bacterium CG23_combo_of_CG06-09_8_20_14_all_40_11]
MLSYIYNLATDRHKGLVAGVVKSFLYFLSLIYGLGVRVSIFIYRLKPYHLNCKVISVGNITLGGTGKTTLVLFIAQYLKQKGHKVAILSRGYKRKITNYQLPITNYETMGDEPYMLKMNLGDVPVVVDTDRIRAAKLAIRDYGADTVILDDGLQQWRIKKDLDIVTIDATRPFGNRKLIPRGILREPLSSLKRADVFVLTKTNLSPTGHKIKDFLGRINPKALQIESIHSPLGFCRLDKPGELLDINILPGKTVTLFSAIGDPDSFEGIIRSLGIKIGLSFRFRDHHNYTQEELDNIIQKSKDRNIDTLVTTEKDAARLYELRVTSYELRVLFLRIELKIIKDEQEFYNRLLGLYSY